VALDFAKREERERAAKEATHFIAQLNWLNHLETKRART